MFLIRGGPGLWFFALIGAAAARASGDVVRDERTEHGHVIVTRSADMLRMFMFRWHSSVSYLRCEAALSGAYARALPAFEQACATARVLPWEFPDSYP